MTVCAGNYGDSLLNRGVSGMTDLELSGPSESHTYTVQRFRIKPGLPLTFSAGERIVAVLRSDVVPGGVNDSDQMDLIVLVELPRL